MIHRKLRPGRSFLSQVIAYLAENIVNFELDKFCGIWSDFEPLEEIGVIGDLVIGSSGIEVVGFA